MYLDRTFLKEVKCKGSMNSRGLVTFITRTLELRAELHPLISVETLAHRESINDL